MYATVFKAFQTRCNDRHLKIGRNGRSPFGKLPYYRFVRASTAPVSGLDLPLCSQCIACKPSLMYRIPLAHAFCNGFVKGFWQVMSRSSKVALQDGNDIILSQEARNNIRDKVKELRGTTCFSAAMPDIIKCARAWRRLTCRLICPYAWPWPAQLWHMHAQVSVVRVEVEVQWQQLHNGGQTHVGRHGVCIRLA